MTQERRFLLFRGTALLETINAVTAGRRPPSVLAADAETGAVIAGGEIG